MGLERKRGVRLSPRPGSCVSSLRRPSIPYYSPRLRVSAVFVRALFLLRDLFLNRLLSLVEGSFGVELATPYIFEAVIDLRRPGWILFEVVAAGAVVHRVHDELPGRVGEQQGIVGCFD